MGDLLNTLAGGVQGAVGATGLQSNQAAAPPQSYMVPLTPAAEMLPGVPQGVVGDVSQAAPQTAQAGMPPAVAALLGQPAQPEMEAPDEPYVNPYAGGVDEPIEEQLSDDEDITVEGDPWQPDKLNTLEKIADFFLKGNLRYGNKQKNMKSALQGAVRDPERAIARMRQVDPKMAWKMQEDLTRMKANQALVLNREGERLKTGGGVMGGMLEAIQKSPDPKAAYQKLLPILQTYGDKYGVPPEAFDPEYDPERVNTLIGSGISAYQQRYLEHQKEALGALTQHRGATLEQDEDQFQRSEERKERQHRETEMRLGAKNDNGSRSIFSADRRDAGGRPAPIGTMSKDGRTAALKDESGEWRVFRLQTPGDISTRVYSEGDTEIFRKKLEGK